MSSIRLQTNQKNLFGGMFTVNGRPYRVDNNGIVEFTFEEDAAKALRCGGWSDKIVEPRRKAPVVEQGKFKSGKDFLVFLAANPGEAQRAGRMSTFAGLSATARNMGFLLSSADAFQLDCADFQKSNRAAAEELWRLVPAMRPLSSAPPAPKAPTVPSKKPQAEAEGEDEDPPARVANLGDFDVDDDEEEGEGEEQEEEDSGEGATGEEIPDPDMSMTIGRLRELATLYKVPHTAKTTKKELIDSTMKAMYPPDGKK